MPASSDETAAASAIGKQVGMWNQQKICSFYRDYARQYETEVCDSPGLYPAPFLLGNWCMDWFLQQQQQLAASGSEASTPAALRVLDLGCGTGQSCQQFLQWNQENQQQKSKLGNFELIGVDTTPEVSAKFLCFSFCVSMVSG